MQHSPPIMGLEQQLATRNNHFNMVRLFLATFVCFDHAGLIASGLSSTEMIRLANLSSGYLAVNAFFFLSGILITRSLEERGVSRYYLASRLLRLYPALIALAFIATLILGPIVASGQYWVGLGNLGYALQVLIFGDVSGGPVAFYPGNPIPNEFSSPLWTLRYELLCYLAAPVLFLLGFQKRTEIVVSGVVGLAFMISFLPWAKGTVLDIPHVSDVLRFAFCFGLGMAVWQLRKYVTGQFSWVIATSVGFVICGLLGFGEVIAGTLWVSAIVLWMGLRLPLKRHVETDLSYGIYIWHFPIMQILFGEVSGLTEWSLLFMTVPITLIVAWLSWTFIERPALNFRNYFRPKTT